MSEEIFIYPNKTYNVLQSSSQINILVWIFVEKDHRSANYTRIRQFFFTTQVNLKFNASNKPPVTEFVKHDKLTVTVKYRTWDHGKVLFGWTQQKNQVIKIGSITTGLLSIQCPNFWQNNCYFQNGSID